MRTGPYRFESTRTPVSIEKRTSGLLRWGLGHRIRRLVLLFMCLMGVHLGVFPADCHEDHGDAQGKPSLDSVFSELELVRCVFREGRLVVRYQGELKILHFGDELQDAGLKVVEAKDDWIVLHTIETRSLPSGPTLPKAMVILSPGPEGKVRIQTFSSEPPDGETAFDAPQSEATIGPAFPKGSGSKPLAPEPPAPGSTTEARQAEDQPQ